MCIIIRIHIFPFFLETHSPDPPWPPLTGPGATWSTPRLHDTMERSMELWMFESSLRSYMVHYGPIWSYMVLYLHLCQILSNNFRHRILMNFVSFNFRPKGGERKLRFIWAWKHDGILMGFGHAEYRLPRDLAGFVPVTICFQHRPKMPRRGSSEKSLCWTQTCASPCWSKSNSS